MPSATGSLIFRETPSLIPNGFTVLLPIDVFSKLPFAWPPKAPRLRRTPQAKLTLPGWLEWAGREFPPPANPLDCARAVTAPGYQSGFATPAKNVRIPLREVRTICFLA